MLPGFEPEEVGGAVFAAPVLPPVIGLSGFAYAGPPGLAPGGPAFEVEFCISIKSLNL